MAVKKSHLLTLFTLCAPFFIVFAQDIEIPMTGGSNGLNYIKLGINGNPTNFIFDTGANGLTINQAVFNDLKRKNAMSSSDITGTTSVTLANGNQVSASTINIRSLEVGNKVITNVQGVIMPNNAPPLVGENVLKQLGQVTANFGQKKIIISQNTSTSQPGIGGIPTTNPPKQGISILGGINKIRVIPCDYQDISQVKILIQKLKNDPNFSHMTIEEESNIPPANAVQRIMTGTITVRYFDNNTKRLIAQSEFLAPIRQVVQSSSNYSNAIRNEDMLPSYNNQSIPRYVEIWIRQN